MQRVLIPGEEFPTKSFISEDMAIIKPWQHNNSLKAQ